MTFKSNSLSRRELLCRAAFGATGLTLLGRTAAFAQPKPFRPPYAPFRMGLQSYSLRNFGLDDALAKTRELGLTLWEGYPAHLPLTEDAAAISGYKEKLHAHGIHMVAYGVLDFTNDEADARKKFDFGRAMGIETISAHPTLDSLSLLDKLVAEYRINIAIHNHGPGDLYDKWEKVQDAIQGHNPRIGACVDTGHYLRADSNPVTAIMKLGKRVYDIHLKNVKIGPNGQKEFTEIGETGGLMDVLMMFRFLKEQNYKGLIALEYEEHADDPMPYMQKSLEAVRRYIDTTNHFGIPTTS